MSTGKTALVEIAGRTIRQDYPPLIVAEMSGNHNQSLERALAIVDAAADAGAHALKLQTYTADTITLDLAEREFFISDPASLWKGTSLHALYQQAHTPWEWHKPIFERCRARGIIPFSSPFDASAVDFLEELDCPAYKIASPENVDIPLIKKAASTGKPLIISTGMATAAELDEAVSTARAAGNGGVILLKCTTSYPASPEHSNLRTIPHLRELFDVAVGLSDHTLGVGVALASVALGASLIEKHFTLNRADGGVDSVFSIDPGELRTLVDESERIWKALGAVRYGPTELEVRNVKSRRSLYIAQDMRPGDTLTPENLRSVRPGHGLHTRYYELLLGRKINTAAPKGTPMSWDLIG